MKSEAIQHLHGCSSEFLERVPVKEAFRGKAVWDGEVHISDQARTA